MLATVLRVGHDDGEPVEETIGHRGLRRGRAIDVAGASRLRRVVRRFQRRDCLLHHLVTHQVLLLLVLETVQTLWAMLLLHVLYDVFFCGDRV